MKLIINKRVSSQYQIQKVYTAGVVLHGPEVKSLRLKSGSLQGSFVKIINNEAFLLNAQITPYAFANNEEYDPKRTRKLLLSKNEITDLSQATNNKGWVIVPLALELVNNRIKVSIGLGRGKKQFEKRAELKKRDIERSIHKELKTKVRLH